MAKRSTTLIIALALVTAAIAGIVLFAMSRQSAHTLFEKQLGFAPGPEIHNLQADSWFLFDSGSVYMQFETSQDMVNRLASSGFHIRQLPGKEVHPWDSSAASMASLIGGPNVPSWWTPPFHEAQGITCYEKVQHNADFASETELIWYDSNTRTAWYLFLGID